MHTAYMFNNLKYLLSDNFRAILSLFRRLIFILIDVISEYRKAMLFSFYWIRI